jgi:hypothetical protein
MSSELPERSLNGSAGELRRRLPMTTLGLWAIEQDVVEMERNLRSVREQW